MIDKLSSWMASFQDKTKTLADMSGQVEAELPKDGDARLETITSFIAALLLQIAEIWIIGSILVLIVEKEKLYLRGGYSSVDDWAAKSFNKSSETIRRWKVVGNMMSTLGSDLPRLTQDQYLQLAKIADKNPELDIRETSTGLVRSASYIDGSIDSKKLNTEIRKKLPAKEVKLIAMYKLIADLKKSLEQHMISKSKDADKATAQKLLKLIESNA